MKLAIAAIRRIDEVLQAEHSQAVERWKNEAERTGPDGKKPGCLTSRQVEAVRKLYRGPINSRGEVISLPGAPRGSEKSWPDLYTGSVAKPSAAYRFAGEPFRYYALQPTPGPTWKPEDFDFDRDYKRLGMAEGLISPVNPDLRKFKTRQHGEP